MLYEQRIDDSIAKRAKSNGEEEIRQQSTLRPRVTIRNYSSLTDVDLVRTSTNTPANNGGDVFLLTFRSGLTNESSQLEYDVVVCATGYDRSSWLQLLRRSELGKHFIHGDPSSSGPVHVLPDHTQENDSEASLPSDLHIRAPGTTSGSTSTSTSSSINTPPTSPRSFSPILGGGSDLHDTGRGPPSKVYVTRTYQLVPKVAGAEPLPRVHIQGCTESTHGLSDTLLSVVSVRAGEIAGDLMSA